MEENKNLFVCGIDEAGRGPLAGPVSAACVILPKDFDVALLDDSKALSPKKREILAAKIKDEALAWSVFHVDHKTIDEINILQATLLAMKGAFESLHTSSGEKYMGKIDEVIVDGLYIPKITIDENCVCRALVKADAKISEVMAASILAKTERDKLMCEYAKQYPLYEYEKHKGYPTKRHVELCKKYGPSPIQRLTFKY